MASYNDVKTQFFADYLTTLGLDSTGFAALDPAEKADKEKDFDAFAQKMWDDMIKAQEADYKSKNPGKTDAEVTADVAAEMAKKDFKDKEFDQLKKDIEAEIKTINTNPKGHGNPNPNSPDWHEEYAKKYKWLSHQKSYGFAHESNSEGLDIKLTRNGETEPFMQAKFTERNKVGLEIKDIEGARAAVKEFKHLGYDRVNVSDKFTKEQQAFMMIAALENNAEFFVNKQPVKFDDLGITDQAIIDAYNKALVVQKDVQERTTKIDELRDRARENQATGKDKKDPADLAKHESDLGTRTHDLYTKAEKEFLAAKTANAADPKVVAYETKEKELNNLTTSGASTEEIMQKRKEVLASMVEFLPDNEKAEYHAKTKEYDDIIRRKQGREIRKEQAQLITDGTKLIPAGPEKNKLDDIEKKMADIVAIREGKVPDPSDPTGAKNLPARKLTDKENEDLMGYAAERKKMGLESLNKNDPAKYKKYNDNKDALKERGEKTNAYQNDPRTKDRY